jgi:hypothetical protein
VNLNAALITHHEGISASRRRGSRTLSLVLIFLASIAFSYPAQVYADPLVERGWELYETISPGTVFFLRGVGLTPFDGVPLGTFDFTTGTGGDFGRGLGTQSVAQTDTVIKRTNVAPGLPIPIELVALQLVSHDPINLGAGLDFHYVTLQSARGGPLTTGNNAINFGPEGNPHGTFSSFFDLFFDVRLGSTSGPIVYSDNLRLLTDLESWAHDPPPNALMILAANRFLDGSDQSEDFWLTAASVPLTLSNPSGTTILLAPATITAVPEPSTLILLSTGAVGTDEKSETA